MPCDIRGLVDHRLIGGGIPLLKDHGGPCIVRSLKVQCAEGAAALRAGAKASFTHQGVTETARFHWARSTPQSDDITLSGPFSVNRQTIERWDDQLIWRDGEQVRPLSDLDPDSPAITALTAIPPEKLGHWLLGAEPDSSVWGVEVTEWQAVPPWQAPSRVTIRGSGLEIKVIISQWEFSPAP